MTTKTNITIKATLVAAAIGTVAAVSLVENGPTRPPGCLAPMPVECCEYLDDTRPPIHCQPYLPTPVPLGQDEPEALRDVEVPASMFVEIPSATVLILGAEGSADGGG